MFGRRKTVNSLGPGELAAAMEEGKVTLIDVREPGEFAAGHIAGAINRPLSAFDPEALPKDDRQLVLYCAAGSRSAMALARCRGIRDDVNTHLQSGIGSWQRVGLAVTR